MTERSEEVVYLNNCEIFIEALTLKRKGTYYLVWKKGKKNTQSNMYQISPDDPAHPKEILSLSLKVYYEGGVAK